GVSKRKLKALEEFKNFIQCKGLLQQIIIVPVQRGQVDNSTMATMLLILLSVMQAGYISCDKCATTDKLQPEIIFLALPLPPDCLSSGFPHLAFRKLVHNSLNRKLSSSRNKAEKPTTTLHIDQNQNWLLGVQDEHLLRMWNYVTIVFLGGKNFGLAFLSGKTNDIHQKMSMP
ncbi:hypothetical protein A6R68_20180, partial [Neotoma lepida]